MKTIHKYELLAHTTTFRLPKDVTMAVKSVDMSICLWYDSTQSFDCVYEVVGTGHPFEKGTLVQTVVLPDGFYVFHLIRVEG